MFCTVSDQLQMAAAIAHKKRGPSLRFKWFTCCLVPIRPGTGAPVKEGALGQAGG